jgi:hypothetical protein
MVGSSIASFITMRCATCQLHQDWSNTITQNTKN